ncbi:alpha/beta fold hydrolase [Halomonas halocynthiae]|uniref:alpha/beta fold hydrolase n=1 Tax=Halomonas halocynthiae TaxID=176290 RepID=UPI00041E8740|nr:alpha/beta hydrolase [Halomonas halocynthiae]
MDFLTIHGRSVAYRLLGNSEKPLLLLAHPLGMSQAVWDSLLPSLLPHVRVLTWDLPGHGASEAWQGECITPKDLATEAIALANHANSTHFHFIGTSIGGVIGQQLLVEQAERLSSVTLTNTGAVIGTNELWSARAARVREEGLAAMSHDIVPRWFAEPYLEANPALKAGWMTQMGRSDDESYALLCEMLGTCDFSAHLNGIRSHHPHLDVYLLGGSDDLATTPATLDALATALDGAPLSILAGVGHVPSVENPSALLSHLLNRLHENG